MPTADPYGDPYADIVQGGSRDDEPQAGGPGDDRTPSGQSYARLRTMYTGADSLGGNIQHDDDPYATIARGGSTASTSVQQLSDDPYDAIARGGHTAGESIPQQILHGVEDIGTGAYQAVRHPLNTIGSLAKGAWEGYRDATLAPLDITPAMLGKSGPGANQHIIIPGAGDLLGVEPVTPERQAEATQRTAANVLLPLVGPGGLAGRTAVNAALGAINSEPGQRIRGAVGAVGLGEILHRAVGALTGYGAEPEAAATPAVDEAPPPSGPAESATDDPYAAIAQAEPSAEPVADQTARSTSGPIAGETPAPAAAPVSSTDPYADIARGVQGAGAVPAGGRTITMQVSGDERSAILTPDQSTQWDAAQESYQNRLQTIDQFYQKGTAEYGAAQRAAAMQNAAERRQISGLLTSKELGAAVKAGSYTPPNEVTPGTPAPPSAAPSAPVPVQAGELPAVASEPPMTEIDYTGDKPVVVNAAPAKATRAPRSAKIDQTIPGREKISAHDQNYAGMPVGDLLDELHTQYGELDKAASNPAIAGWARFDDDTSAGLRGIGLSGGIARAQQKFALQRVMAVERELTRRGVAPEEMAEQMQIRRDRALEQPLDEDEEGDLSFPGAPETSAATQPGGSNVGGIGIPASTLADAGGNVRGVEPADVGLGRAGGGRERAAPPSGVRDVGGTGDWSPALGAGEPLGTPGAVADAAGGARVAGVSDPSGALRSGEPLLATRLDKFDLDPTGRTELAAEITRLDRAGQLPKGHVSFPEMRAQAMDFARSIGADPLTVDQTKLRNLSGPEIVGLKNVVSRNTDELLTASKQLADPTLDVATKAALADRLDALRTQRESLLSAIVTNTSDRARDLGFLRQISTRSLDPDVWEIQARRTAGRPLSDLEAARVRGLANDAAQICGMAAD